MAADERFEEFFRVNWSRVVQFVHRRIGDHGAAQDVAQDCFVEAFRQFRRGGSPTVAWVYGVARNHVKQCYRRLRHDAALCTRLAAERPPALLDHSADMVAETLADLTDSQREILVLSYWEGLSAAEIGTVLGLSEATVWQRLSRARRSARELLHRSMNDDRRCGTE